MARAKLHKGNFPDPEFYRFLVRCGHWKVYVSREMNENGLHTLKVVSLVPKEKSNFYLTFSLSLGRIIKNKNRGIFEERHPEDLKGIEEVLRWSLSGSGRRRGLGMKGL